MTAWVAALDGGAEVAVTDEPPVIMLSPELLGAFGSSSSVIDVKHSLYATFVRVPFSLYEKLLPSTRYMVTVET